MSKVGSIRENRRPMRITSDPEVAAPTQERLAGRQGNWVGQDAAHRQQSRTAPESVSDSAPTQPGRAAYRSPRRIERESRQRRPLAVALLFSLLIHAVLLSLRFGGEEFGLPGFAFPWRDRRVQVPDLRVVLVPAHITPAAPTAVSAGEPPRTVSVDPPSTLAPMPAP